MMIRRIGIDIFMPSHIHVLCTLHYVILLSIYVQHVQTLINDDEHADGGGHAVGRTLNKIISHDHICTLHLRI